LEVVIDLDEFSFRMDIRREPVWMHRAWFWMLQSFRMLEREGLGNNTGDA
jgi:hypothetical protein